MRRLWRRFVGLSASLLLVLGFASGASAQDDETHPPRYDLMVVPAVVTPSLLPMAEGFAEWIRIRAQEGGVIVAPGKALRRILGKELAAKQKAGRKSPDTALDPSRPFSTKELLEHARRQDAAEALFIDLRRHGGKVEADFRFYDVESGELIGGGLAVATPDHLVYESEEALAYIDQQLALPTGLFEPEDLRRIGVDSLAAATRSLRLMDQGQLSLAWRESGGRSSLLDRKLEARIDRLAARPTTSAAERARLLLARGEAEKAWQWIADKAPEAYSEPGGQTRTLVAAGEIQLQRGVLDQSRAYFARALEVNPRDAEAQLGMAQQLVAEGRPADARVAFARAADLAPQSPRPLEIAAFAEQNTRARAELHLKAAGQHSRQWNRDAAKQNLDTAAQINPKVDLRASRLSGDLHAQVGDHEKAIQSYQHASKLAPPGPSLLMALGRSQSGAGRLEQSEKTYQRILKEIDPRHPVALVELAAVYVDQGNDDRAIPLYRQARAIEPSSVRPRRELAHALTRRDGEGDKTEALALLEAANAAEPLESRDLLALAALQAEKGDYVAAARTLERALDERELDTQVQADLIEVMKLQGDSEGASRFARRFSRAGLGEFIVTQEEFDDYINEAPVQEAGFEELGGLVASFAQPERKIERVVMLGVREARTPKDRALDWFHLKTTDTEALESTLARLIASGYQLEELGPLGQFFGKEVEKLYQFDSDQSRSIEIITDVNINFETDAAFVARLTRMPGDPRTLYGSCRNLPHFEIELRRLAGQHDVDVQVLSNTACLSGGVDGEFGRWNQKAAASYGGLLLLLLYPILRGWGRVTVRFTVPSNAAALFAVKLSRRPGKVRDRSDKMKLAAASTFRKQLRNLALFERRLRGDFMVFKWVAARRGDYYLTVRGPLVDLVSNELIGEFLEERVFQVKRGQKLRVDFDLRAREAAVTILVKRSGEPVGQARAAIRGRPNSDRYCSEGKALMYVGLGNHVISVGSEDRVVEQPLLIDELVPVEMKFDLDQDIVFEGCPQAVGPYLDSDFQGAADALAQAGQDLISRQVRTLRSGAPASSTVTDAPQTEPGIAAAEAAVYSDDATSFQPTAEESAEIAPLLEEEGDHVGAAEAYRLAGDLANAARCYEEAYDWPNAIECYQDAGDTEKVLVLMERAGEIYEAGAFAEECGQLDRAIHNYQQIDSRHPRYIETCRRLAELMSAKEEWDIAVEKFDEAIRLAGGVTDASLEMLGQYANLLEKAGRHEQALKVYEGIRLRDLHFGDVTARIESLKKQVTEAPTQLSREDTSGNERTVVSPARASQQESRYEILDELGRGGMGIVYKAKDKHLQRIVALKVLSEHLRQHQSALDLFLREARSAAALNHRNIVTVYDAGQEGSMDFISMEHLEGSGLDAILKHRGSLNARTAASVALQIAAGLHYAQEHKIIHRDIKPSNLFITNDKVVKIMDFGLAKMVEEVRRASTIIGGTPNYMAPEQAIGKATDHRADLYALGATLFHLVTGSVPFEDGDATYHHAHTPPPDPREREVTVPAAMAELILKLMAKEPGDRVQSAHEVAVVLQQILRDG